MPDILQLGQQWPDGCANNKFWIGVNMMRPMVQHGGQPMVLGHECTSIEDLESVAAEIRADLNHILQEARKKFAKRSK